MEIRFEYSLVETFQMPPTRSFCSKTSIFSKTFSASRYLAQSDAAERGESVMGYFAAARPDGPAPIIATRETGLYDPILPWSTLRYKTEGRSREYRVLVQEKPNIAI